uniref:Otoraplin n=1 Tax=Neogobius melanostomus TaxID=47308 RepID=A0A8C6UJX5_9GOBI
MLSSICHDGYRRQRLFRWTNWGITRFVAMQNVLVSNNKQCMPIIALLFPSIGSHLCFFPPDVLSMAIALDDFIAPDCRFINIKKEQMVYVYSKLVPEEGAGVFWSGSVYGERYVDQMGIIGYFPATMVNETQKFREGTGKIPTTDTDFYCY